MEQYKIKTHTLTATMETGPDIKNFIGHMAAGCNNQPRQRTQE